MGFIEAPQDVSFATMRERSEAVNAVVARGSGRRSGGFVRRWRQFDEQHRHRVRRLKPKPARKGSPDDVIARLRPRLARLSGVSLYLQSAQDLRVGGRASRTQYQYTLQDVDLRELTTWAPRLLAALKKLPELRDVATDQQNAGLELALELDRDTASRLGVSSALFDNVLYDAYGQRQGRDHVHRPQRIPRRDGGRAVLRLGSE